MMMLSSRNLFLTLLNQITYSYTGKPRKIPSLHQRMKKYGKYPELY